MFNLREYLLNGHTVADLEANFAIKCRTHPIYPQLHQFKYDQINSPNWSPLVIQSRGTILDAVNNWKYVARPFDRFFNFGEGYAAPIDWDSAKVQVKLDGSLTFLYHFDGKWHVATSGTPDAGGEVNGFNFTFAELFWKTWDKLGYDLSKLQTNFTYIFELTSPYNRVVVPYKEDRLTLLAIRHTETGQESTLSNLGLALIKVPSCHELQSIYDIEKFFDENDGLYNEGFVVVDKDFNRIKVKHPAYLKLHHLKGNGVTNRSIIELIRIGEDTEFLSYFSEFVDDFNKIRDKYENLLKEINYIYTLYQNIESQKTFALAVKDFKFSSVLFEMRKNNTIAENYLKNMQVNKLEEWLGL